MRFRVSACVAAVALLVLPQPSVAQDFGDEPPAHIAFTEGSTTLTREGERDVADVGMPVVPGDVVRTDRGRLEVLFPDGSALDLDEFSTFEILSSSRYRLTDGRARLTLTGVSNPRDAARISIDTPVASADLVGPGEFKISLDGSVSGLQARLDVIRGSARFINERGATDLRAGEESVAWDAAAPSYARYFNAARLDAFDQWAASLRDDRYGNRSAQYLPADLRMYGGVLDRNGSWAYEADYGYVWYPSVAVDWRPYDDGYWWSVPQYGWTWIGAGVWAWPTHHYGRWGYVRNRWFWIPERHFAPAWVSWGAAPGYVSWCPLGYDNRPVFALSVSVGNRWGGNGWTVINRDYFGRSRGSVRQYAVRSLPISTPFIQQSSAPLPAPRGRENGRFAGTRDRRGDVSSSRGFAVPRGGPATPPPAPVDRSRDAQIIRRGPGGSYGDRGPNDRVASPPNDSREAPGRSAPRDRESSRDGGYAVPRDNGTRPQTTWTAPAPVAPYNPARPRRDDPPSSFEPARPVAPTQPAVPAPDRPRRADVPARAPGSFEAAPPAAPYRGAQSRDGAAQSQSAPPERNERAERRGDARGGGDRSAGRQQSSTGDRQSQSHGDGGGRAQARRR